MDFRDQFIKEALDKTVGRYRPEKRLRSRLVRIAAIAALALVAVLVVAEGILNRSAPKPAPPASAQRPVSVDILPAPRDRIAR